MQYLLKTICFFRDYIVFAFPLLFMVCSKVTRIVLWVLFWHRRISRNPNFWSNCSTLDESLPGICNIRLGCVTTITTASLLAIGNTWYTLATPFLRDYYHEGPRFKRPISYGYITSSLNPSTTNIFACGNQSTRAMLSSRCLSRRIRNRLIREFDGPFDWNSSAQLIHLVLAWFNCHIPMESKKKLKLRSTVLMLRIICIMAGMESKILVFVWISTS